MSIEHRIEKLEEQAEMAVEGNYAGWVFICSSDREGPTSEDKDRFTKTYVARFGNPKSPVMVTTCGGRMSAVKDGEVVEVRYEDKPYQGALRPFKEMIPQDLN